jgi:hypothetical protein
MHMVHWICSFGLVVLLPCDIIAQTNGAAAAGLAAGAALGASSSQSSTAPASAGGANAPIEMNVIVYGGIKRIAADIAKAVAPKVGGTDTATSSTCRNGKAMLLEDSTSTNLLAIYFTWDGLQKALAAQLAQLQTQVSTDADKIAAIRKNLQDAIDEFNQRPTPPPPPRGGRASVGRPLTPEELEEVRQLTGLTAMMLAEGTASSATGTGAAAPATPIGLTYLGDLGTALSTAKSGISYAASSITPATQAMTAELGHALCSYNVTLYTSASFINLKDASSTVLARVGSLQEVNATIQAKAALDVTLPPLTGAAKNDHDLEILAAKAALDIKPLAAAVASTASVSNQILTSFLTWEVGSDNAGSIVMSDVVRAQMLDDAMKDGIPTLQFNMNAAGGNTRTNSYFLFNLFYTPKPSFNGGVVVTYELRDGHNYFILGDTLKILYDYSKWKPDCFAMKSSEEVNTTSLNSGIYTKANRTGPAFVCETK